MKGEFKPGDRMVEGVLARELGVSQTSLREALQELEHQGLVTRIDNRGTFVTMISLEEVDQLYGVRKQLEPFAASLGRARMTPAKYQEFVELLARMRIAGQRHDLVELAHVDLEFHQMIWRLSGNKWLERALRLVCPPLLAFDYVGLYGAPTYDFESAHSQHEALLHALNTGTPEDARRTFENILEVFRLQDIANLRALDAAGALSQRTRPTSKTRGESKRRSASRLPR